MEPQQDVAWVIAGNGPAGTIGVGRPASQLGPGLVTAGGRLLMVWRGIGDDKNLWFTQAAPDANVPGQTIAEWSTQANVAGFATSSRPAIESTRIAAREKGYEKFFAFVRADNAGALSFYKRIGFNCI